VGIIWLLGMAHIVSWSTLNALFTLWPLVLVAFGIGFIFRSNRVVRTLSWLVLLAVVIGYGYFVPSDKALLRYDLHFGDGTNGTGMADSEVVLEKRPQNERAELKLDYGAAKISADSDTKALLEAEVNGDLVTHSENLDGRTATIQFEMKDKGLINIGPASNLKNEFHLSKEVVWNLEMNTGAADGEIDLSGLKVEELNVRTGAATLELDLGSYNTKIKMKSGASDIHITLPADAGMEIQMDGGLNNTNLGRDGWTKKGGRYYSPGYDSKNFKISAEIDNGFGNLTVENG
jgi:hypothetical protein